MNDKYKLTIEIGTSTVNNKAVINYTCKELDISFDSPDENLQADLSNLGDLIQEQLVALVDGGFTSTLTDLLITAELLDEIRYSIFRRNLVAAFVKAYPKAKGHWNVMLLIPFVDFDCDEWLSREQEAYKDLINNGASGVKWTSFVRELTALTLPGYVKHQQREKYQSWIDLGLPVKPYEEIIKR